MLFFQTSRHKEGLIILSAIILLVGASYLVYGFPAVSDAPTASLSPEPSPVITPKLLSLRLDYVRQQLVAEGLDVAGVQKLLDDARLQLYPIEQVEYKPPNWSLVKKKLYDPAFVQKGKNYIKTHQAIFDSAEKEFEVPKEIVTGIIAIETDFGESSGTTGTFNALYSRMEQWPIDEWRAQASQLVALATYCLQSQQDCFEIRGSYAGALGIVQFMPVSLLAYGIDGNKDGSINLYQPVDAIPSAANFLKAHGWQEDQKKALARYYGSSVGYPDIVLRYASLLVK